MTDAINSAADDRPPAGSDARADLCQFVIFHSAGERFAVPLARVKEIIRVPEVVRMPLSPAALLGLANLRGTVLPVLDLRSISGLPAVLVDEASRVVVLDHGHPVGLMVDRVANVVSVERARIEPAERLNAAVDDALLTGMIKDEAGGGVIMILDVAAAIGRTFAAIDAAVREAAAAPGQAAAEPDAAMVVADEDQLVSFEVDGQEYAFPIAEVQEIVQLPAAVTQVPGVPAHVLGVTTLRDRLLPLVSLRAIFGLPPAARTDTNKVVVVSLSGGDGAAASVGVVMDKVNAVLRVDRAAVEPLPATLARGHAAGRRDIQSICRLDGGRRLVSVLSAEAMFDPAELATWHAGGEASGGTVDEDREGEAVMSDARGEDSQYVIFRLMGEEYGVPVEAVQEIVRVPEQLTYVPRTPSFIEGVINLRGTVLPVIDQRRRFGLAETARSDRQRIMVYTVRDQQIGFIVDSVSEVGRIPAAAIAQAPALAGERAKVVRGIANLTAQQRMIQLLDVDCLVDASEEAALQPLTAA